jgi:hypothetical protein
MHYGKPYSLKGCESESLIFKRLFSGPLVFQRLIVHCLKGSFISELQGGEKFTLSEGMTYIVQMKLSAHRSQSDNGVQLLIIDGDFLKYNDDLI